MNETTHAPAESSSAKPSPASSSGQAPGAATRAIASQAEGYDAQTALLSPVQRAGDNARQAPGDVHAAAAHGIGGGGGAMPFGAQIQQSFGGYDISNIQAHTDANAADATAAMGADAYATGNHVAFGGAPDLHTAAHEAAHVVQQRAGVSLSGGVGQSGDPYEQHADRVADAVVAGQSAEPVLAQMAGAPGSTSQGVQKQSLQRHTSDRPPIVPVAGGNANSPLANGSAPVMAIQFDGRNNNETPPAESTEPTTPALPEGAAEAGLQWAKPKLSQSGKAQVWYLVPATETDTEKVELTAGRQRFYVPNDAGLEGKAMAFERALGLHAFDSDAAKDAGSAMAGAVMAILDDYMAHLQKAGATLGGFEAEIGNMIGMTTEGFAGAVGKSEKALREAASGAGNVREQLAIATNFAWNFGKSFVAKSEQTDLDAFIAGLEGDHPNLTKALNVAVETKNGNLTGTLKSDGKSERDESRKLIGQQKDMRTTTLAVDSKLAGTEQGQTVAGSKEAGINAATTPGATPIAPVSPREARQQLGKPEASDAEALAEIEGMRLKWNEGIRRFVLDENHPWIQAMRAQNIPVAAGPSGTTKGVMEARQLLGVSSALNARAAAIGYLLPINAHSLIEILIGAASVDGPAPVPMDFGVYLHVAPFDGKSLYADEEFWAAVEATEKEKRGGGVTK
jgi:hypothetical protein